MSGDEAPPPGLGTPRRTLEVCGSTNDLALAWARDGAPHGAVITAEAQTAGRGRLGRTWASPPGGNLYLSMVVRLGPGLPTPPLTLAVGVAVCDAVRDAGVEAAGLKWPNDVLVGGRKLAGVLCETAGAAIVVGVGVGLRGVAELPPEIARRATSIADELGRPVDRDGFLERTLAQLTTWVGRYQAGGVAAIAPAWEARMVPGLRVRTDRAAGRVDGLAADGALRVIDDAGRLHEVRSGDVEWIA